MCFLVTFRRVRLRSSPALRVRGEPDQPGRLQAAVHADRVGQRERVRRVVRHQPTAGADFRVAAAVGLDVGLAAGDHTDHAHVRHRRISVPVARPRRRRVSGRKRLVALADPAR